MLGSSKPTVRFRDGLRLLYAEEKGMGAGWKDHGIPVQVVGDGERVTKRWVFRELEL